MQGGRKEGVRKKGRKKEGSRWRVKGREGRKERKKKTEHLGHLVPTLLHPGNARFGLEGSSTTHCPLLRLCHL